MELDNRVGDYAAAIVHDVDLLLENSDHLNDEQQEYANEFRKQAARFQSLYNELSPHFTELTQESRIYAFDLRSPLGNVGSYCDLLLSGQFGSLSQSQLELLQQIKSAYDFILNAFITWVNP
jgi:hypothetical protein